MDDEEARHISLSEFAQIDPVRAADVFAAHVREAHERDGTKPPAEDLPPDGIATRCNFCQAGPPDWWYPLRDAEYRAASPHGYSPGRPMLACERCADLFDDGHDERLVALFLEALAAEDLEMFSASTFVDQMRGKLVAFHAAAGNRAHLVQRPEP